MRTIIAGSRDLTDYSNVIEAITLAEARGIIPTVVLSGTARGVDRLGERWAIENHVKLEKYPANWEEFKLRAGHIRNELMASKADALIAIYDGKSSGTKDMISLAMQYGLKVYVYIGK